MLFCLANLRCIADLDADDNIKLMFLPIFATEAISKKNCGKAKTAISINVEILIATSEKKRHFLTSASKFLPNFAAKRIAPIGPKTSFSTHWNAAAATVAYVYDLIKNKRLKRQ